VGIGGAGALGVNGLAMAMGRAAEDEVEDLARRLALADSLPPIARRLDGGLARDLSAGLVLAYDSLDLIRATRSSIRALEP